MQAVANKIRPHRYQGSVYCPLCTHTVRGELIQYGKSVSVVPGQKCSRCSSSLDAGYVMRYDRAA